jgi:ABC-2 type transport system permease protein
MATYGAMNALFTGGGVIAGERAIGWSRQLRIAGVPRRDYVTTKVLVSYLTAVPGLVAVLVLGAAVNHVQLSATQWVGSAIAILVGLLPVAALGVAIGYAARPQSLPPIFGIGSALLSLLGGLWIPAETFPPLLRDAMKLLPTYWSADAGRAVLRQGWIGWQGVAVLTVWTALFGVIAAWLYQRDSLRPSAAGAT